MSPEPIADPHNDKLIGLATEIVEAYVSHNQVAVTEIQFILTTVYKSLAGLTLPTTAPNGNGSTTPAVSIKKSIGDDFIICLEDGKKLKMLKRYLRSRYNLTPDEYRSKWRLPSDYPMVAPAYAKMRSAFAKSIGLGRTSVWRQKKKAKK